MPRAPDVSFFLAKILLGHRDSARAAADDLGRRGLWSSAITQSVACGVTPPLRERVAAFDLPLDTDARSRLRKIGAAAAAQSTVIARRAAEVGDRLHRAGIRVAVFKGVGVIANLYQAASRRMVRDIDMFINDEDLPAALQILADLGFSLRGSSAPFETWVQRLRHKPALMDKKRVQIDLHWGSGAIRGVQSKLRSQMRTKGIIARAEVVELYGRRISVASPMDAIVLAAHDMMHDNFNLATALKDLCDLANWWTVEPERWRVRETSDHAQLDGMAATLFATWKTLAAFDPTSPASRGVSKLETCVSSQVRASADEFEALLKFQLREGSLNLDLLKLFNPSSIRQFIVNQIRKHPDRPAFLPRLYRLLVDLLSLGPRKLAGYRTFKRKSGWRPLPQSNKKHMG
jgi:hypothetical protein